MSDGCSGPIFCHDGPSKPLLNTGWATAEVSCNVPQDRDIGTGCVCSGNHLGMHMVFSGYQATHFSICDFLKYKITWLSIIVCILRNTLSFLWLGRLLLNSILHNHLKKGFGSSPPPQPLTSWKTRLSWWKEQGTHAKSLKSEKTYICLKLSIAITGQSAGVFWMWRSGCLNLSQSACKKFIEPLKSEEANLHFVSFKNARYRIQLSQHKRTSHK